MLLPSLSGSPGTAGQPGYSRAAGQTSSIHHMLSMSFPPTTPLSRLPMTSKIRFLCDGAAGVSVKCYFSRLSSPLSALLELQKT
jgi:hypothetical protein